MDAPYRTSSTGSSRTAGSTRTSGTVQGSKAGFERGVGRGVMRISSGESSGAERSDGRSRVAESGLPPCTAASASDGRANGCGRAECNAWLGLFTVRSESSAQMQQPFEADQNPCKTSMLNLFRDVPGSRVTAAADRTETATPRALTLPADQQNAVRRSGEKMVHVSE